MLTIPHVLTRRAFVAQAGQGLSGLALAGAFAPASASAAKNLKQLITDFYAVYESLEVEKLLGFYAEDCRLDDPTFHFKVEGKEKLRALFARQRPLFLSVKFEIKTLLLSGPHAISQHIQTGLIKPSLVRPESPPEAAPLRYVVEGISLFEFAREKIKRQTDFYDVLTFRQQSGLS